MKIFKKTLIIAVLLVVVLGASKLVFGAESPLLESEGRLDSVLDGELFSLLIEIKSIELNGDILSDKAFLSLKDFGVDIKKQPVGRENPFSDI